MPVAVGQQLLERCRRVRVLLTRGVAAAAAHLAHGGVERRNAIGILGLQVGAVRGIKRGW